MKKPGPTTSRLAAAFLLGCLLFNFPLIALFNVRGTFLGVPILHAYLFAAWALLIAVVALLFEGGD